MSVQTSRGFLHLLSPGLETNELFREKMYLAIDGLGEATTGKSGRAEIGVASFINNKTQQKAEAKKGKDRGSRGWVGGIAR